jgi:hypothetical protein
MLGFFGVVPVDEPKKLAVWSKGRIIQGCDPAVWRRDEFGRTIRYADFRERSQYGWDLFPIQPPGISAKIRFPICARCVGAVMPERRP